MLLPIQTDLIHPANAVRVFIDYSPISRLSIDLALKVVSIVLIFAKSPFVEPQIKVVRLGILHGGDLSVGYDRSPT